MQYNYRAREKNCFIYKYTEIYCNLLTKKLQTCIHGVIVPLGSIELTDFTIFSLITALISLSNSTYGFSSPSNN